MKPSSAKWVKIALTALVLAPLLVGLGWREAIRACDFISQGALLLVIVALPFCPVADSSFMRHFAPIFLAGLAWGVWRFGYFDPVTRNDIPGIGYLLVPFMMGAMSAAVLVLRGWLSGRFSKKTP